LSQERNPFQRQIWPRRAYRAVDTGGYGHQVVPVDLYRLHDLPFPEGRLKLTLLPENRQQAAASHGARRYSGLELTRCPWPTWG
jgi:hypothetical protein